VVVASGGYPDKFVKGMEITGADALKSMKDVIAFHAGTKAGRRAADKGKIFVTSGGRVLNITALGINFRGAVDNCYNAVSKIRFDDMHYRRDIGERAIEKG